MSLTDDELRKLADAVCFDEPSLAPSFDWSQEAEVIVGDALRGAADEIADLKRRLAEEEKHTNAYIGFLHTAQKQRDEALAKLAEVTKDHRWECLARAENAALREALVSARTDLASHGHYRDADKCQAALTPATFGRCVARGALDKEETK